MESALIQMSLIPVPEAPTSMKSIKCGAIIVLIMPSSDDEKWCIGFAWGIHYLWDWYLLFTYRQHHNQLSLRLMLTADLLQKVFRLNLAFWIGHDNYPVLTFNFVGLKFTNKTHIFVRRISNWNTLLNHCLCKWLISAINLPFLQK